MAVEKRCGPRKISEKSSKISAEAYEQKKKDLAKCLEEKIAENKHLKLQRS